MNRTALIDQIQQARETLEKLLTLLQSAPVERDRFVSHLYQARREYRRTCETAGKSGKQIERCVIASFGSPRAWALRANFANGRTCCGSEIDHGNLASARGPYKSVDFRECLWTSTQDCFPQRLW